MLYYGHQQYQSIVNQTSTHTAKKYIILSPLRNSRTSLSELAALLQAQIVFQQLYNDKNWPKTLFYPSNTLPLMFYLIKNILYHFLWTVVLRFENSQLEVMAILIQGLEIGRITAKYKVNLTVYANDVLLFTKLDNLVSVRSITLKSWKTFPHGRLNLERVCHTRTRIFYIFVWVYIFPTAIQLKEMLIN